MAIVKQKTLDVTTYCNEMKILGKDEYTTLYYKNTLGTNVGSIRKTPQKMIEDGALSDNQLEELQILLAKIADFYNPER